ncbi:MAG: AtpZ/AtpI family protein [Candidatus Hydrogenedentes bacterium]|nr:AtpZ/AtpI family protein [Candidatus Hydrogenedentota bacterium]
MRQRSNPPRESIGIMNAYGRYASLGIQLAVSMCLFGWVGYWLDGKLETSPWLMIIGLMLGAGAGFYALILTVNAGMKQEALEAADSKASPSKDSPLKNNEPPT